MTPTFYIENFCRVSDRRKALYKKIFDKNKIKTETGGHSSDKEEFLDLPVPMTIPKIIYIY